MMTLISALQQSTLLPHHDGVVTVLLHSGFVQGCRQRILGTMDAQQKKNLSNVATAKEEGKYLPVDGSWVAEFEDAFAEFDEAMAELEEAVSAAKEKTTRKLRNEALQLCLRVCHCRNTSLTHYECCWKNTAWPTYMADSTGRYLRNGLLPLEDTPENREIEATGMDVIFPEMAASMSLPFGHLPRSFDRFSRRKVPSAKWQRGTGLCTPNVWIGSATLSFGVMCTGCRTSRSCFVVPRSGTERWKRTATKRD
jgi:hypothetical protein